MIKKKVSIAGKEYVMGYAILSPLSTRTYNKPGFVFPTTEMIALESSLASLFADANSYQHLHDMPASIHNVLFTLPSINDDTERIHLLIEGLPTSFIPEQSVDDTLTFRALAVDIVQSTEKHFKDLGIAQPAALKMANRFYLNNSVTVKQLRVSK